MKPTSEELERPNERLSGILERNEDEEPRNNLSSGSLCRNGLARAEIVESIDEFTLLPVITKRGELGPTVYSETWEAYTGITAKGYVRRLLNH